MLEGLTIEMVSAYSPFPLRGEHIMSLQALINPTYQAASQISGVLKPGREEGKGP